MTQTKKNGLKGFFEKLFEKRADEEQNCSPNNSEECTEHPSGSEDDWKKKYNLTMTDIQDRGIGTM
ncbi:MAG: hypothetical protein IKV72_04875 [Firmicutes bacterium]|nr:hypothetical protein [Bacillota bacterium]